MLLRIILILAILLLIYLLYKYYWNIQFNFNDQILNSITPPVFSNGYTPEINCNCRQIRVVFASLLRDVENRLPQIIQKVEHMGSMFLDYRVLIVENDSKDKTREILLLWAKQNPKVIILGCGKNTKECSMKFPKTIGHSVDYTRIKKMVDLRNIYLTEIQKNYNFYDYVIMWDLDIVGNVYLDGVSKTIEYFENNPYISVICANGIYRWGPLNLFYDSYATLDLNETFHIDTKKIHDIRKGLFEHQHSYGEDLVEVQSCFSGFAIYNMKYLLDLDVYYELNTDNNNIECEHTTFHKKLKGKKYINPSMIYLVLKND